MTQACTVLGIESSCDETAASIVRANAQQGHTILSNIIRGQTNLHAAFGGVVPEIAARAHVEILDHVTQEALDRAGLTLDDCDAIAVTAGPGLIGGVLSGVMFAKGLAAASARPLIGVNHLVGHALTPRLTDGIAYPYLMLLVSGGHCQFLIVSSHDQYHRLGGTIDDAPGEAFDKVARLLGLEQPGGPSIENTAKNGDPRAFNLPRPLLDRADCDMSFSGLKTAVLRQRDACMERNEGLRVKDQADLAASFQASVVDVLADKTKRAIEHYLALKPAHACLAVAGGVAANGKIREALEKVSSEAGCRFLAPPLALCTDNAAMIAWAGIERYRAGQLDEMTLSARPRWPLDTRQTPLLGSGKKGAKA